MYLYGFSSVFQGGKLFPFPSVNYTILHGTRNYPTHLESGPAILDYTSYIYTLEKTNTLNQVHPPQISCDHELTV